jgi:hypothetical protein
MDWKKLSEEAQGLEEAKEEEAQKKAQDAKAAPRPRAGDTMLHPVLGRCVYAGDRGDGMIYIRRPDGRVVKLSPDRVSITPSADQPRTFLLKVFKSG